ncbi:MAG: glutamate--tRNA ligase [Candidatus Krumholzibacteriia bacterium]
MTVRVRFAPSPTGYLHIGGARTALFNFLFARHEGGVFVLRVDDTDQTRNSDESLRTILEGLQWLGLEWDEGPHHQADRRERYLETARELEARGRAYWREDEGKGRALVHAIERGRIAWDDAIHGPSGMDTTNDNDLVILKSDGYPTYNFATVVDEHDFAITHVIRGDEHFSNTPKQISLLRALDWELPTFAHVPLIYDPQGRKISKREKYDFPVTIQEAQEMGYLPDALRNFISLLGWSPGGDRELMTLEEMVGLFTLDRVGSTPARFLLDKLRWFNGTWLRRMPPPERLAAARPYLARAGYDLSGLSEAWLEGLMSLYLERMEMLPQFARDARFFFVDTLEFDEKAVDGILRKEGAAARLARARDALAALPAFAAPAIHELLQTLSAELGCKLGDLAQPIRVAITGTKVSPPIDTTLALLGREKTLARIEAALQRI